MRKKKIRGHNRRHKQIENWRLDNLSLDLNEYLLNENDCYYAKIRVRPWSGLSLTNSEIPEPNRKTKQKILTGLLDIYEGWKIQLDKLEQPYYLKIWLFEPRFCKSQVVCAIGERIEYYEKLFFKPALDKVIQLDNYSSLNTKLSELNWDYRLDEDTYENTEVGEPEIYATIQDYVETKKWFAKLLKKPHRTTQLEEPIGETTELYSFKRGDLWLGEK